MTQTTVGPHAHIAVQRNEIKRLREENDRLRSLLVPMAKWFGNYPEWVPRPECMDEVVAACRAAKAACPQEPIS